MSTKPQLSDVISDAIRSELATVHTSLPGRIVDYDQATQIATVQISVQFSRRGLDDERIPYTPSPLSGVPILWPTGGGGKYSDTWPLERGDEVWVHFAERSIDEWVMSDTSVVTPASVRRFNLSDAVATPAQSSRKSPLPGEAVADARVIRGEEIRLGSASASDYVALASLVKAELDALWNAFNSHTHPIVVTPAPASSPTLTPGLAGGVGAGKVKAE